MSFLNRLFGAKDEPAKSEGKLQQRLERMEAEAANAAPAYVGSTYNRMGDLALRAGDPERAAGYYGRAIDAFLEDGQREAARGVANKIIRVRPGAVRTLCTLTWLDLASRHMATALLHLRDYVAAAKDVDEYALAANQVYAMARIVADPEFLDAAADALDGLDFSHRAEEVREWAGQDGSSDALRDSEELAAACVSAAVRTNERSKSDPQVKPKKKPD
jgi:tetratricopeptide (TPR) repeat protein